MPYYKGMFLTNHALTGALIGLELPTPAAVPAAFASHFFMDGLPHHDRPEWRHYAGFTQKSFLIVGSLDSVLAVAVTVGVCLLRPERAAHIVTGAFFAVLPDLFYVPEIFFKVRLDKPLRRFHEWVQWCVAPRYIVVELAWAGLIVWLISRI